MSAQPNTTHVDHNNGKRNNKFNGKQKHHNQQNYRSKHSNGKNYKYKSFEEKDAQHLKYLQHNSETVETIVLGDSHVERLFWNHHAKGLIKNFKTVCLAGTKNAKISNVQSKWNSIQQELKTCVERKYENLKRVVICVGTFDLIETSQPNIDQIANDLSSLISSIQESELTVTLMTAPLVYDTREDLYFVYKHNFNKLASMYRQIGADDVIDLYSEFTLSNGKRREDYFCDNIHLNKRGYQYLIRALELDVDE